jgi:ankyrin repeat protein
MSLVEQFFSNLKYEMSDDDYCYYMANEIEEPQKPSIEDTIKGLEASLRAGIDVNVQDEKNATALMYACTFENQKGDIVKYLLDAGADINLEDENGFTALWYAISSSNNEAVDLLLTAGSNVNHQSKIGYTPLLYAVQSGHIEVIDKIISAGADINHQAGNSLTPLLMACTFHHDEIIEKLLSLGAKFKNETMDEKQRTFFMKIICHLKAAEGKNYHNLNV